MRHAMRATYGMLVAAMVTGSVPAIAQTDCGTAPVVLPVELADWGNRGPVTAATTAGQFDTASLSAGQAVDATLSAIGSVHFVTAPQKPGEMSTYGGMFVFAVREAGTYRVALGSAAWIDVLKSGAPVQSSAHGHGPECSGIRKIVDFPLDPGRYVLQLSGSTTASMPIMVARRP